MTTVSIAFIVLEILIIGVGALIGYKRGAGRSAVRLVYLTVIGIASFFIARSIAFKMSIPIFESVMKLISNTDVKLVFEKSPELELLIENLVGAIMAPIIFALLFLVLQLLTLICFRLASSKIVALITKKSDEPSSQSKFIGLGVGLVSAVAIAAILLSPVYMVMHVIDNTSEETVDIFLDTIGGENTLNSATPERVLKAQITTAKMEVKPSFEVTKAHPISSFITERICRYEVPVAHEKESVMHTLHILVDIAGDVLYVHNSTVSDGGTSMEALSNSVAAITPHLDESLTVRDVAACALSALGEILIEDHEFMGISLPASENAIIEQATNSVLDTMAHTTLDTVDENITMIFGVVGDEYLPESKRHNVFDPGYAANDYEGKAGLLTTVEKLKTSDNPQAILQQALGIFGDNADMSNMINDMIAEYIAASMPEDVALGKDTIKEILDNSNIDLSEIDITNISKEDIGEIITSGDLVLDDATMDAIRKYLGNDNITKEDVDNFLNNGGDITDHLGDIIPGGNDTPSGDIDLGDVDLGDIDLGDVDLGDVDLGDIDLSDIDINSIDFTTITPEQLEALRAKYGDILDIYLN